MASNALELLPNGSSSLSKVDISFNKLTGSLNPLFFRAFPRMTSFKSVGNRMVGQIPGEVIFSTFMEEVDISYNRHTGIIPNLSFLTNMKSFRADGNLFNGNLPVISGLQYFEEFSISNNSVVIDSSTFASLLSLPKLTRIDLSYNRIEGGIPVIQNPAVNSLNLFSCSLTGSIDPSFYSWRLQSLNLSRNSLTGIIGAFRSDPVDLDLSDNQFTGGVGFIGSLASIKNLNISNNHFEGQVPDISGQKALVTFDVSNNQLSGSPPAFSIQNFASLEVVDLHSNQFTGSAVVLMNSGRLRLADFSLNQLNNASQFLLPDNATCNLGGNNLNCPVGKSAFLCGEPSPTFPCKPSDTKSSGGLTLIIGTSYQSFDSNAFVKSLSESLTVSSDRFSVHSVSASSYSSKKRSEGTQLDLNVSPPKERNNYEGSALQVVQDVVNSVRNNPNAVPGYTAEPLTDAKNREVISGRLGIPFPVK
eukprot:TRINITY_DN4405_c0_g1_i7.p1 TRINITY_DN4405_c0_g1~~TRINITY_DN4405_c0_g1_i7.p1  ORF type:complete len:475 (+),score=146.37 TRINITY_DN4405_c0_g1_i7:1175-2599(+)